MRLVAVQNALESLYRSDLYKARRRVGLSAIGPLGLTFLLLLSVGAGGCSLSRSDSAFAQFESDVTGSIKPATAAGAEGPTETDLAFARTAASDVLTKGGKDSSQPWENPSSGARGSVTPLAASYAAEGRTCRDFLASYVKGRSESWLHGAACKSAQGRWEIHLLKPWRRT